MKKFLFFTVATATVMALTGCSQSSDLTENETETSQKAISFDTYLSNTRAGDPGDITSNDILAAKGFGLFGYYTGTNNYSASTTPNFMYNTKVSGNPWNYSPMRYWSNNANDMFSFFAYAPYVDVTPSSGAANNNTSGITALSANNISGAPFVLYQLSTDLTNSVDLLWGVKKGDNTAMNTNLKKSTSPVGFTFKHALAKWGGADFLQAKIATDDATFDPAKTKITIQSISIASSAIATNGKFDLTTGVWSNTNNNGSMAFNISKDDMTADVAEISGSDITNTNDWNKIKGLSTTASNVYKDNTKSIYFIPVNTSATATVTITYWTRTLDPNLQNGCTNVKQTVTKDIQLPAFAVNKKYTIVLTIGLNSISFAAEISNWTSDGDAATTTVNLPEVAK